MPSIVALIDFSDLTPAVVRIARDLARGLQKNLILLHVSMPTPDSVLQYMPEGPPLEAPADSIRSKRVLEIIETECKKLGAETSTLLVPARTVRGNPVHTILEEVTRLQPGMIVIGSHGHGPLYNLVLGTVSSTLVKQSPCPVVIVPARMSAMDPAWKINPPA